MNGNRDRPGRLPLLRTKLWVPQVRSARVARPRLMARLNQGMDGKLMLVSAPAGFGKTTLVAEWLLSMGGRARAVPSAWLSLDEGDNDPARFLAYLVAALQGIDDEWGHTALEMSYAPEPPSWTGTLTPLVNEIAAHSARSILVLDDYHEITAQPIHEMLAFLVDHMPSSSQGMRLVILTRADPPLPLHRLRAQGELTELRADDLRFTLKEATAFLNELMGLELTPQQIGALEARTEGWVAGLQLAALSLQELEPDGNVASFIEAFTGSHRYVMDYLVEEVLIRQPPGIQEFLLRTCILDRVSGPLCDAVVDKTNSEEILERLEQSNLFTVALDHDRHWYRYHHLFADLLRDRLRHTEPEWEPELHRRASEWYERNGAVVEAINHALAAQDYETCARLAQEAGGTLLRRGELLTLLRWLDGLPDDVVCARPRLCLIHAWALLLTGQVQAVESRLQDVERGLRRDESVARRGETWVLNTVGEVAAIRAYLAYLAGDSTRTVDLAQEALQRLHEQNLTVRSVVAYLLGSARWCRGDCASAEESFAEAVKLGQAAGNLHLAAPAACRLADMQMMNGQLREALASYQRVLHIGTEGARGALPVTAEAYLGLGEVRYEWNDLEAATHCVTEGIKLSQQWGNAGVMAHGHHALARIRQAQGDLDGALDLLQQAREIAQQYAVSPFTDARLAAHRVELLLARGNVAAASGCATERGLSANDELPYARELELIALLRVLIAQGRPDEAVSLATRLLEAAEAAGRTGRVIHILAIRSLALQAQGDMRNALATLKRALSLAEPEGYVRGFVDEGPPMATLLRHALAQGVATQYVGRLLAAFAGPGMAEPLVEPLTTRELEVLRLIAVGLRNQEIADQLVISLATVKRHISNIYGKLGVSHRTQAVARARELGLLQSGA